MSYFNKNQNPVAKRIESSKEQRPDLLLHITPVRNKNGKVSNKKFNIEIKHPNTKVVLYMKSHTARSFEDAFLKGREIKKSFASEETWLEEVKHIPSPKRGKMKLDLKDGSEDNN